MRRAAKKDLNHNDIVTTLRDIPGIHVYINNLDPWDITVGVAGKNYFYEIKKDKKSKLTDSQKKFQQTWSGHWKRVESVEDILQDLGLRKREYATQEDIAWSFADASR